MSGERRRTRLVGRQRELTDLRKLLADRRERVVTLVGPGGVGKSRLAGELAATGRSVVGSDIHVVDLASVDCAEGVYERFTGALGLPSTLVGKQFRPRDMPARPALTVIDNAEHVAAPVARLLRLLSGCRSLQFVVTSREPLRLYDEQIFPVRPLPVGHLAGLSAADLARTPVVRLFVERARQFSPQYRLTSEDAGYVREICRLLDGLPLAVELAAARMKLLRPQALLSRLQDSLDVLEPGGAESSGRRRSLCAAISSSFTGLTAEQLDMVCALSIFAGTFDLPAVQAVTGATGRAAERITELLVDKSVITVSEHRGDGEPRFEMLRTMRTYVRRRLRCTDRDGVVAARHAEYYVARAREAASGLTGPEQGAVLAALARDHDNIDRALRYLVERGETGAAAQLLADLSRYVIGRGHVGKAHRWLNSVMSGEAAAICSADPWLLYGVLCACVRQDTRARPPLAAALDRFEQRHDSVGRMQTLAMLGHLALLRGELDEAERQLVHAERLTADNGYWPSYPSALSGIALLAMLRGAPERAEEACAEQMNRCMAHGDTMMAAVCSVRTGLARMARRDLGAARALCVAGLRDLRGIRNLPGLAFGIEALALLECAPDGPRRYLRAARMMGAAESIRSAANCAFPSCGPGALGRARAALRDVLGSDVYEQERQAGRALSVTDAVGVALLVDHLPGARNSGVVPSRMLTPRERQVAALVADGRTNRQIAAELAVSEWTAINHLRHIMRKLNCHSRIDVAKWVLRNRDRFDRNTH